MNELDYEKLIFELVLKGDSIIYIDNNEILIGNIDDIKTNTSFITPNNDNLCYWCIKSKKTKDDVITTSLVIFEEIDTLKRAVRVLMKISQK